MRLRAPSEGWRRLLLPLPPPLLLTVAGPLLRAVPEGRMPCQPAAAAAVTAAQVLRQGGRGAQSPRLLPWWEKRLAGRRRHTGEGTSSKWGEGIGEVGRRDAQVVGMREVGPSLTNKARSVGGDARVNTL